jgi:hypothetical protein
MAGTFKINEQVVWMPAGWVFDGILELIAVEIENQDVNLAALLSQARADGAKYGDLRKIGADQFNLLLRSTERAYAKALEAGPSHFHDPRYYAGFSEHFKILVDLLRADSRAK